MLDNRQRCLTFVRDAGVRQLEAEALFIHGLEQSGTEGAMHFDRKPDDPPGQCGA